MMRAWGWDNPVVTKEFRGRMRGSRAYWLLFGYLLLLSLTLFFAYLQWWSAHAAAMEMGGGAESFTIGRTFFLTLFAAQAILVTLITPALTSGAISLEREQRTFEMLRTTTLSPRAIAGGKLASSVSFIVLLLTSSLPLVSLCFLLGGVSPGEVFFGYVLLVADAFLFGAMGLAWSAHAASTAAATALTYGSVFVWFALTFPFTLPTLSGISSTRFGAPFGAVNPIGAVMGAIEPENYYGWTLAGWIPALLLTLTLGMTLVLACVNCLEDDPARRAWPLRLATLCFCGLTLFFANGALFTLRSAFALPQINFLLLWALGAVIVFVPPFVTGDAVWGSPRRLMMGLLPSGLLFALVLTGLVVGMMFVAVALSGGHTPSVILSSALWQGAVLFASITVGLGGLGLLLSALLRNRWAALLSLYLLMVLGMGLPYFSYATLTGHDAQAAMAHPAINSLYLCPTVALTQISSAVSSFQTTYPVVQGMVGSGSAPFWAVTMVLYLLIGTVCYGIGWVLLRNITSARTVKTA